MRRKKPQHFLDHRALSLQHFFGTDRSLTPGVNLFNIWFWTVLDHFSFFFIPLSKNLFSASPPSGWTILANITSKSVWFIYEFKVWDPLTLTPFSWTHERHIILLHTHVDSKASTSTQVTGISKNLHVNKTIRSLMDSGVFSVIHAGWMDRATLATDTFIKITLW